MVLYYLLHSLYSFNFVLTVLLYQFNVILLVCCLRVITGNSNVTADTTHLINPVRETRETKHEMINSIMFGIIGLAAVLFIIYMVYIYIITLEKRIVYTTPI